MLPAMSFAWILAFSILILLLLGICLRRILQISISAGHEVSAIIMLAPLFNHVLISLVSWEFKRQKSTIKRSNHEYGFG